MVLCGVECVQNVAKYLEVPLKKIYNSENNVRWLFFVISYWGYVLNQPVKENFICLSLIIIYQITYLYFNQQVVATDALVKNQTIEGFITIIQSLAKSSKCEDILGKDKITQALTKQWLEYAILHVNYADMPTNIRRILKVNKWI